MELLTTALVSAAMTTAGTAAGVWLVRPAMKVAFASDDMAGYRQLRKLLRVLVAVGGGCVVAMLTLATLLKAGFFPTDLLTVVQKPLGASLWVPPMGIGAILVMLTGRR